jgi:glycosyltransferase involved in cell wall biosynthesis
VRLVDFSPLPVAPVTNGASVRIQALCRRLARRHDVDVVTIAWGPRAPRRGGIDTTEPFPGMRQHVIQSPAAWAVLELARHSWVGTPVSAGAALRVAGLRRLGALLEPADAIVVEFPWQAAYLRRAAPDVPLVLMAHNFEAGKFRSWADSQGVSADRSPWVRYAARAEARAVALADGVVTVSPQDREAMLERYGLDPERVAVVPNGADVEAITPATASEREAARRRLGLPDRPVVLFVGAPMAANRAALPWIRRLAERTDRFTFVVVGKVARAERGPNLVCTGWVDDLAPYLAASSIALCPIRHGGGTKIKLLEYLAAGLPTVAFAPALGGTDLRAGRDVLVVEPRDDALLAAVGELAADPERAGRLGAAGRAAVEARYSWEDSAEALEPLLEELVSASGRTPTWPLRARTPA